MKINRKIRCRWKKQLLCAAVSLGLIVQAGASAWAREDFLIGDAEIEEMQQDSAQSDGAANSAAGDLIEDQGVSEGITQGELDWGDLILEEGSVPEDPLPGEMESQSQSEEDSLSGETESQSQGEEGSLPGETESQSQSEEDLLPGESGSSSQEPAELQEETEPETEPLLEETETELDLEGLFEEESETEGEVLTLTETVELRDPSVVPDQTKSPGIALFRARNMVSYHGSFGNQLSGMAREMYNIRVSYYVSQRRTGNLQLAKRKAANADPEIQVVPELLKKFGSFQAEVVTNSSGQSQIRTDTAAYQQFVFQIEQAMQASLDAFVYDHPEIFWLRGGSYSMAIEAVGSAKGGYTGSLKSLTYIPTEAFPGAKSLMSSYDAAVPQVTASIKAGADADQNGVLTGYELVKAAHDYVCQRFFYDSQAYANYQTTKDYRIFCSAGAFLGNVGTGVVCEGYAKSLKVLCDQMGIPCVLIGGTAIQNGRSEGHMWNGVQIEGKWYLVDATWDDTGSGVAYRFFLVGDRPNSHVSSGNFNGSGNSVVFAYPSLESSGFALQEHEYECTATVASTCRTAGTKTYVCRICGASYQEELPVDTNAHRYVKKVTAATCLSDGYTTYTCSNPGCTFRYQGDKTKKLGHTYKNGQCIRCRAGDTIVKAKVSGISNQKYAGKSITLPIKVAFGSNVLKAGIDYKVTYQKNKSVGTAKVTIKGIGRYTGTLTRSFKISKKSVTALKYTGNKDRTYTGKSQKPEITVKNGSVRLKQNRDYTVQYSKNKNIGTGVITIKGKGSYTGTKKLYFKILPKKVSWRSVASKKKGSLTLSWKKVSQASGYQIQYSQKSNFKNSRSVSVGAGTASRTIQKLSRGKLYYVRIRTYKKVGSKKYYSAWSSVKKVRIHK